MPAPSDLLAFAIELKIDEAPALFLALSADGAVNRGGSGKVGSDEKDVFMAQTDGTLYREVSGMIDPSWMEKEGLHRWPGKVGPPHVLKLSFFYPDRAPIVLAFEYRSDLLPPREIYEFVQRAIAVTQPWYDGQREMVARLDAEAAPAEKPWWKFW